MNPPASLDLVGAGNTRFAALFAYQRRSREVPKPTSGDDANKKGTAVQVSTPAAMFPV